MKNKHILIRSDNTCTISYVKKLGGMDHPLHDHVAKLIWNLAKDHNFWIQISHKAGLGKPADFPSRDLNIHAKWVLPKQTFQAVCSTFSTLEIDLFAWRINTKLPKYFSWQPDPYATQVNAFSVNWSNIFCYAFPPFILLSRPLTKIRREEVTAIIILLN